jgi:hypothetical protein
VRDRVFIWLDVSWNAMHLRCLAVSGVLVDAIGIRPLYWIGGMFLGQTIFRLAAGTTH